MGRLPEYAALLACYHRAFEPELRRMVAALPVAAGDRVLDVACGDGVYSGWLSERTGRGGLVVGLDADEAFLELARDQSRPGRVALVEADAFRLPFRAGCFDVVWCAQSLYSLPHPVKALRALRHAARPGGVVAVLENDSLHQILLSWPVVLELAVQRAELAAFRKKLPEWSKYYLARRLPRLFRRAGLVDCQVRTWVANRQAPLGAREREYLAAYLSDLADRIAGRLKPKFADWFGRLVDPRSPDYLLNDPDLSVTTVDHVAVGRRPNNR